MICRYAALLFVVLLSGCEENSSKSLECSWSAEGLLRKDCDLIAGKSLQGISIGMDAHAAFLPLCNAKREDQAIFFTTLKDGRWGRAHRPISCADWRFFDGALVWGVKSKGAPCSAKAERDEAVHLWRGRIAGIHVWCPGLTSATANDFAPVTLWDRLFENQAARPNRN
jgi:hypothetical protein